MITSFALYFRNYKPIYYGNMLSDIRLKNRYITRFILSTSTMRKAAVQTKNGIRISRDNITKEFQNEQL